MFCSQLHGDLESPRRIPCARPDATRRSRLLLLCLLLVVWLTPSVAHAADPACLANQLPVAVVGADQSVDVGTSLTFDGSNSYDTDGVVVGYYYWFSDTAGLSAPQDFTTTATFTRSFDAVGIVRCRLYCLDNCGDISLADECTITVVEADPCAGNLPPTADLGPDLTGLVNQPLTLSAAASFDPEGEFLDFFWIMGDGGRAMGETVEHTYTSPGSYQVRLLVFDPCWGYALDSLTVVISDDPCAGNQPPSAVVGGDSSGDVGDTLSFDGSGSSDPEGPLASYAWDFGDGSTGQGMTASHAYAAAGTYTVSLQVTDACGAQDDAQLSVTVSAAGQPSPLSANFTFEPAAPVTEEDVQFAAESADWVNQGLAICWWSFSDGMAVYAPVFTRVFHNPGDYTATLNLYVYDTGQILSHTEPFSVAQRHEMQLLALLEGEGYVSSALATVGDVAWVADEQGRLRTVDVSVPDQPQLVGETTLYGIPKQIAADGGIIAVAARYGGLYLFDATAPETLSPVGHYTTYNGDNFQPTGVALSGARAFVAGRFDSGGGELRVLDIQDPSSPALQGVTASPGSPAVVLALQNRLVLGDASLQGVHLVNIDPDDPHHAFLDVLDTLATANRPYDLAVDGTLLAVVEKENYTSSAPGSIALVDVVNSDTLSFRDRIGGQSTQYRSVCFYNGALYATYLSSVMKLDMSNPSDPVLDVVSLNPGSGSVIRLSASGTLCAGIDGEVLATVEP